MSRVRNLMNVPAAGAPPRHHVAEPTKPKQPRRRMDSMRSLPRFQPFSTVQRTLALLVLALSVLLAAGMVMASPANAQTYFEADAPGGAFSANFASPTPIPGGFDAVAGLGAVGANDFIMFQNLAPGAQTLTFTVSRPAGAPNNHRATGEILYKVGAFSFAWDGTQIGSYRLTPGNRQASYTLTLDASYDGTPLHVGFYYTSGSPVAWRIEGVTTAPPPDPGPGPGNCTDQGIFTAANAPGGAYSSEFAAPTVIGAGWSGMAGQAAGGQNVFVKYEGLPPGDQSLVFTVSLPQEMLNQWTGGTVRWSTDPFPWAWAGNVLGDFDLSPDTPTVTLTLATGADFAGELYLGLYFTYGGTMNFAGTRPPCLDPVALPELRLRKLVRVFDQTGQGCASFPGTPAPAPQAAIPGACMEFVIRTTNIGSAAATDLQIIDVLGPEFVFVTAEAVGFDGSAASFLLSLPQADTDCASAHCAVQMQDAGLAPGQFGEIRIRTLLK